MTAACGRAQTLLASVFGHEWGGWGASLTRGPFNRRFFSPGVGGQGPGNLQPRGVAGTGFAMVFPAEWGSLG
ncbi:MAG: hypothetical protein CM15mP74_32660 [Halieaceae bacterium]|nr:MAG: hypothetical protein CM15mP74_32660 [Halieaceae bacterium]